MAASRQSPLFHRHEQDGANFVDHHGWRVPAYFTFAQKEAEQLSKAVALGDLSWMVKLDLKGREMPAIDAPVCTLGVRHFLVICDPAAKERVLKQLQAPSASGDPSVSRAYVTDVTSVYAQFLVAGPRSRDVLRKLTSLNVSALTNLACGQASLAHAHSIVLRNDLNEIPAFHVFVSREYGESVWEAILHAGHEFHIGPFGLKALDVLAGRL